MTEQVLPADLYRLVRATLSAEETKWGPQGSEHIAVSGVAVEEYDVAVKPALTTANRAASPEAATETLASLLAVDSKGSRFSSAQLACLQGLPRLKALLETSRALRHEDPQGMLRFSKLARFTADRLRMRDLGNHVVADLRALAWAELANAYRVCNELGRADHAMNRAIYWCRRGSQTPLLLARVADLLSDLLGYQRRFPEGRELLALVYRVHTEMGDRHRAGRILVKRAHLASWEGDHQKALLLMRQGFDLLDQSQDPELVIQTLWNMVWLMAQMGRYRSARVLLWRGRVLFTGPIESHRLRWLEAIIHAGLADFPRAEAAFHQARAGFVEHGQIYPAALVSLDLAALWARQGRVKDVLELAEEMIVTFRALRIAREAVAALLVLKRACQYGGEVLDLIEIAVDLLRNLERQPARPRDYSASMPPAPSST